MDCSLPGSSVHGIFQARVQELSAISFSRGSSQPRDGTRVSHIVGKHFAIWPTRVVLISHWWFDGLVAKPCPTLATLWTVARQAPLSMGFSRQGYWSGLPFPSPGDIPHPGIEPRSLALQADSLPTELGGKPYYQNYRKCNHKLNPLVWLYGKKYTYKSLSVDEDVEKLEPSSVADHILTQCSCFKKQFGALRQPRRMVRGGRRKGDSGWGTRVYLWRIHADVWQNQYNIVK